MRGDPPRFSERLYGPGHFLLDCRELRRRSIERTPPAIENTAPVVRTRAGRLRDEVERGVFAFKGRRYAAPL